MIRFSKLCRGTLCWGVLASCARAAAPAHESADDVLNSDPRGPSLGEGTDEESPSSASGSTDVAESPGDNSTLDVPDSAVDVPGPPPIIVLMVGDGMGENQMQVASLHATGRRDALFMQSLPVRGKLRSASIGGITDSAASATTMATGARPWNEMVGLDRNAQPVETVLELARRHGLFTGVVTTTLVSHATPAAFSAHVGSRHQMDVIATQQAIDFTPDFMLGGGRGPFDRENDAGDTLLDVMAARGVNVVATRDELLALPPDATKVVGLFDDSDLDYVVDGRAASVPTLSEMALSAVSRLVASERGGIIMIEGARIDMAGHSNDLRRLIGETLEFDQAVRDVYNAIANLPNASLIVTADHETGGLEILSDGAVGEYSDVSWRWTNHTNELIPVLGFGPGTEVFQGSILDHTWTYEFLRGRVIGEPTVTPARQLVPNGGLSDLRYVAGEFPASDEPALTAATSLRVDADTFGLGLGIAGVFEWNESAAIIFIDVDFGEASGTLLDGTLGSGGTSCGSLIADWASPLPLGSQFRPDFAVVSIGANETKFEHNTGSAGLFDLRGSSANRLHAGMTFGDGAQRHVAGEVKPSEGFEAYLPWSELFGEMMPDFTGKQFAFAAFVFASTDSPEPVAAFPSENLEVPWAAVSMFAVDAAEDARFGATFSAQVVAPNRSLQLAPDERWYLPDFESH